MKVLVTNCTRNSGYVALRALAGRGWCVAGADDRVPRWPLHSRWTEGGYLLLPPEDHGGFSAALLDLVERVRPDVLLPLRGMEAASALQARLGTGCTSLLPTPEAFATCNDKSLLLALCEQVGVPVPRRFDLEHAVTHLREYPGAELVVKPCRDVGGGQGVSFVSDIDTLRDRVRDVSASYGQALVTELIPGPVGALVALHLLFDQDTRLIGAFALRKRRQWPPGSGVTVAAVSTHEATLVRTVLPIFDALRWRGPADVELKVDSRDGVAKILEINPRFSGALAFAIGCGVNLPERYARAALGERLPVDSGTDYCEGSFYVDPSRWMRAVWTARGEPGNWARAATEWRGRVRIAASFDPGGRAAKLMAVTPGLGRRHA